MANSETLTLGHAAETIAYLGNLSTATTEDKENFADELVATGWSHVAPEVGETDLFSLQIEKEVYEVQAVPHVEEISEYAIAVRKSNLKGKQLDLMYISNPVNSTQVEHAYGTRDNGETLEPVVVSSIAHLALTLYATFYEEPESDDA